MVLVPAAAAFVLPALIAYNTIPIVDSVAPSPLRVTLCLRPAAEKFIMVAEQAPTIEPLPPVASERPSRSRKLVSDERAAQLRTGMPQELHALPIYEVESLRGKDAQVRYRVGEVGLEVGPEASARQANYHAAAAQHLLKYQGPLGYARRLVDKVLTVFYLIPGYGTAGFEARIEVRKLRAIEADILRLRSEIESGVAVLENGKALTDSELAIELAGV